MLLLLLFYFLSVFSGLYCRWILCWTIFYNTQCVFRFYSFLRIALTLRRNPYKTLPKKTYPLAQSKSVASQSVFFFSLYWLTQAYKNFFGTIESFLEVRVFKGCFIYFFHTIHTLIWARKIFLIKQESVFCCYLAFWYRFKIKFS